MPLILNRQVLSAALKDVMPVTLARTTIQVLSNVMFSNAGSYITISGTNLECSISIDIDANESDIQDFVIDARLLSQWLANQVSEFVQITVKDAHVLLQAGKSKTKVNVLSADEFPDIVRYKDGGLKVDPLVFSKSMQQAALGASQSLGEARPYCRGVHAVIKNNKLHFTGTDGTYMVHRRMDIPITENAVIGVIPQRCIAALAKLLSNATDDATMVFEASRRLALSFDSKPYKRVYFQTQLIEATPIDSDRYLVQGIDMLMSLNRDELLRSIANGMLFAGDDANRIYFESDTTGMYVRARSNVTGECENYIAATTVSGELGSPFILDGKRVAGWLRSINTDVIQMEAKNGKFPVVFRDAEAADKGYMILPPMVIVNG